MSINVRVVKRYMNDGLSCVSVSLKRSAGKEDGKDWSRLAARRVLASRAAALGRDVMVLWSSLVTEGSQDGKGERI